MFPSIFGVDVAVRSAFSLPVMPVWVEKMEILLLMSVDVVADMWEHGRSCAWVLCNSGVLCSEERCDSCVALQHHDGQFSTALSLSSSWCFHWCWL